MQQAGNFAQVDVSALEVEPVSKGQLLPLSSVEPAVEGLAFVLRVLQVVQLRHPVTGEPATGVELPRYRTLANAWQLTLALPDELKVPIAEPVLERCCEIGVTKPASDMTNATARYLTGVKGKYLI